MKRLCVLFLALALAVVMAAPAFATWTRVVTMGNQNMFIQDDNNIWMWTSTVNNYPRHLIIDHSIDGDSYSFGDVEVDGSTRVGMIVPFLKQMVLGGFISNFDQDWSHNPTGDSPQKIDLFWGWRGTSVDLGIRIDHYSQGEEFGGKVANNVTGINVGGGFNVNGNMLEANVMYEMYDFDNETLGPSPNDPVTEKDAGSDIGFGARYLHAYNSMVTIVPAFQYRTQKLSVVAGPAPTGVGDGEELKTTAWDLGIGCNTVPLQGTEFITSLGVRSASFEGSDTAGVFADFSDAHMPYIMFGTEIQAKSWLALRFGAEKTWDTFTDNGPFVAPLPSEDKFWGASFDYHLGGSVMIGDVQLDLDLNPSWINNGPNFLSGGTTSPMFFFASFKYDYR
jgi:hypothetical protein